MQRLTMLYLAADGKLHSWTGTIITPPPTPPPVVGTPVARITVTSQTNSTIAVSATTSSDVAGVSITKWAWDFGDGSTASTLTASHTYATPGTYNVKLTVTDSVGATSSTTQTVTIAGAVNVPPTISIAAQATSADGLTWQFTLTVGDSDGTVQRIAIGYGDGGAVDSSLATSPGGLQLVWSHTYAASGSYTAGATAYDNSTGVTTVYKTITVTQVTPNRPPVAALNVTTTGMTASYTTTGTSDPDGGTLTYDVDWGDGSAHSTAASNSHTYAAVGPWTVTLVVTDDHGLTATATGVASPAGVVGGAVGDSGTNQTGTSGQQQTGATQYQTLAGSTLQAKVTAAGAGGLSFPAGTFEWPGFSGSGTSGVGIEFVAGTKSLLGAGSASSVLRMTANSDTGHANMTSGTTALFDTHLNSPADGWLIDGLNFQGTPQGSLLYHGMQIETPGNGTISNTTFSGFPGNSGSPPGETFGLSIHNQAAGKTLTVKNSTFDGKQVATGTNVGAAICGTNTTRGVVTFQDCLFENTGYSAGLALWEIATGGVVNLIRPVFKNCHRNLGNEAQGGDINIYDPLFDLPSVSNEDDIRITWTSNFNSGKINLYFTSQSNLNAMMSARGGKKLTSQTTTQQNYGGSAGGVYTGSNLIYNSCHIFVAGVEIDKTPYWTVPAGR